jgi:hypothetical protein
MKEFNSQVCTTIEQSQRLLDLGLKPETADMCHHLSNPQDAESPYTRLVLEDYIYIHLGEEGWEDAVPAWSLHRLLCMFDYDNADTFDIMPNLAYEDVIATISLRINCGAFNKEYLI